MLNGHFILIKTTLVAAKLDGEITALPKKKFGHVAYSIASAIKYYFS